MYLLTCYSLLFFLEGNLVRLQLGKHVFGILRSLFFFKELLFKLGKPRIKLFCEFFFDARSDLFNKSLLFLLFLFFIVQSLSQFALNISHNIGAI